MPKTINLNPFKTVAVTFVAFAVVFANNVINPVLGAETIFARIGTVDICRDLPCSYSSSNASYVTSKHNLTSTPPNPRYLSHIVPGSLTFPSSITYNGQDYAVAPAVGAFWRYHVYPAPYTVVSYNGDPSQNCHGYSTGWGIWYENFQDVVDDDWQKCVHWGDLDGGAVYGNGEHSVRIDEVILTLNNGIQYTVTTTEKFSESGVYSRSFSKIVVPDPEVALDLKGALEFIRLGGTITSVSIDEDTINYFYK